MDQFPIIIALDDVERNTAIDIVQKTSGKVWGVKVHELLIREGFGLISELKKFGNVFVDLKFHDIPATVEKEVTAVATHGADLITVHSNGGIEMLNAAVSAGKEKIVAVTTLTSKPDASSVLQLARQAYNAGVRNIVCSAHEAHAVRSLGTNITIITPGIRPKNANTQDQRRVATPQQALEEGANFLVIGRPITKAPDPSQALQEIIDSIS